MQIIRAASVVTVDKATHVFLGGGIDLDDAEATYHQLFEAYKQIQEEAGKKKASPAMPRLNLSLPKLNMPSIKIQSPFVIAKKGNATSEETKNARNHRELPENAEATDVDRE